jgi:capsular exopolysaccharide synthesis family protein
VSKFEDVTTERLRFDEFLNTQVALLKSDALADRVINELNLSEHPIFTENEKDKNSFALISQLKTWIKSLIQKNNPDENIAHAISMEEVMANQELLDFFKDNLEVSPQKDSTLINVSFLSPSRQLSMDTINILMNEFVNWKMDQKASASIKASQYLMKQIDRSKINLEAAEEKQNQFAKQAGIVSMDSRLNSVFRQLEDINSSMGSAEALLIEKRVLYEQSQIDGPSSLPGVLDSQLINTLKSEYARLRSEYEHLSEKFHEDYPEVKTIKSRMLSIDTRITEESEKIFNSVKHDYQTALNRVDSLNEKLKVAKQQAIDLHERSTQYRIMEREVETSKAIYLSLLERAKEIESMGGITSSNIQIVDLATLPIFPDKPNVKKNLLLAIVLGLMGGIGCAFMVEYFADTITNPDQITDRFQLPILGVIPFEKGKPESPVEQLFTNDPRSAMSEAIRTTRVSIQLSAGDSAAKCLAITSTAPGEGKTTIAMNLAQAFAGAGERVILIDADLRKPRLHKLFQNASISINGNGLSNFLAGIINKDFIAKTSIDNLFLIPSGPIPPNPVELLASNRFSILIKRLNKKYDRIIIDSPPHYGFADILILSRHVDGMILVSSIGETTRDGLRHFKKAMNNVQGTVLGCIVNKMTSINKYGYRYSSYHYQYGPIVKTDKA